MNNKLIIGLFGLTKLLIHLFTANTYDLHRDAFLYFAQGQHLGWGYMEGPPLIAFVARLADFLGGSPLALRFFPAMIGALTIVLACDLVLKLGGSRRAVIITGLAILLSPALLRSNWLFQPVSFNQFFWFLSGYFLILSLRFGKPKYWYLLGLAMGLGVLNKYSIIFYIVALGLAILFTRDRIWLVTWFPYISVLLGVLMVLPNLFWQINHNFPVLEHMRQLQETQLLNVEPLTFLIMQFMFHLYFSVFWIAAVLGSFFIKRFKKYRVVVIALLFTLLIIGSLSGKAYYTIGAYTILIPIGAMVMDYWIVRKRVLTLAVGAMILLSIPMLPYALPILGPDKMIKYGQATYPVFAVLHQWEDGRFYALPQDYADMHGWEELAQRVARVYHSRPKQEQEKCLLIGGSYGHAGSLNYYRQKYDLPEALSFNGSFMMWTPNQIDAEYLIIVEEEPQLESTWFEYTYLLDSIHDTYARDKGYIHFRENPKVDLDEAWEELLQNTKGAFNFK